MERENDWMNPSGGGMDSPLEVGAKGSLHHAFSRFHHVPGVAPLIWPDGAGISQDKPGAAG